MPARTCNGGGSLPDGSARVVRAVHVRRRRRVPDQLRERRRLPGRRTSAWAAACVPPGVGSRAGGAGGGGGPGGAGGAGGATGRHGRRGRHHRRGGQRRYAGAAAGGGTAGTRGRGRRDGRHGGVAAAHRRRGSGRRRRGGTQRAGGRPAARSAGTSAARGGTGCAGYAFCDDFEDGNADGWTPSGGTWSVITDGSHVYQGGNGNSMSLAGPVDVDGPDVAGAREGHAVRRHQHRRTAPASSRARPTRRTSTCSRSTRAARCAC